MKIQIISIGKKHEEAISILINDFEKRLQKYLSKDTLEWKIINSIDRENKKEQKRLESEKILENIKKQDFLVLLDERGSALKSEEFANLLENRMNGSVERVVFVIGGAFGVSEEVFRRANYTLSLSKLVFPHQLVRVILIEQIYRAFSILKGGKYHHE